MCHPGGRVDKRVVPNSILQNAIHPQEEDRIIIIVVQNCLEWMGFAQQTGFPAMIIWTYPGSTMNGRQ